MLLELYSSVFVSEVTRKCEDSIRQFIEMPGDMRKHAIDSFNDKGKGGEFGSGFNYAIARGMFDILADIHRRQQASEWIETDEEAEAAHDMIVDAHQRELDLERRWHRIARLAADDAEKRLLDVREDILAQLRLESEGGITLDVNLDMPEDRVEPLEEDDPLVTPYVKELLRAYKKAVMYGRTGVIPLVNGRMPTDEEMHVLQRLIGSKVKLMGVVKIDGNGNVQPI